jgi:hypothetical protein
LLTCGRLQRLAAQSPLVAPKWATRVAVPSEDGAALDLRHDPKLAAEVLSALPYLSPHAFNPDSNRSTLLIDSRALVLTQYAVNDIIVAIRRLLCQRRLNHRGYEKSDEGAIETKAREDDLSGAASSIAAAVG